MIGDSIAFLAAGGKRSCTTPSTSRRVARGPRVRAVRLSAAVEAGAENVTLCDTNGASLPRGRGGDAGVVDALGDRVAVGIHTHNDAECAVANSLAAVEVGGHSCREP